MAIVSLDSSSPVVRLGHRGPLLVACFTSWPNPAALRAMESAQRQVAASFGPCLSLTIIPPMDVVRDQPRPLPVISDEERGSAVRASAEVGSSVESLTRASAVAILARGLPAIMINAFMTAIILVKPTKFPLKVFRHLSEALDWLQQQSPPTSIPGVQADLVAWLGFDADKPQ